MTRQNISSGAPWEPIVGYSRAVRVGPHISVSGTVASRGGQIVHLTDPYLQAREVLLIITEALAQAGATPEHVVRTRIYITELAHFDEVGRAHGEVFGGIRPATSMVQVAGLVGGALVEIEAEAYLAG